MSLLIYTATRFAGDCRNFTAYRGVIKWNNLIGLICCQSIDLIGPFCRLARRSAQYKGDGLRQVCPKGAADASLLD